MNILCTICSDIVNHSEIIFVTKCGHMFHHHCLVQWIQRSKTCPQCRNKVTEKCMFRLYPTISNDVSGCTDAALLQSQLDAITLQLREEMHLSQEKDRKIARFETELKCCEELIVQTRKNIASHEISSRSLKDKIKYLEVENLQMSKLKSEVECLKQKLQLLNGLNEVLNATSEDVERMVDRYSDVKAMAVFTVALKRALCESENKKLELRDKLFEAKKEVSSNKTKVDDMWNKLIATNDQLEELKRQNKLLSKRKAKNIEKTESETKLDNSFELSERQANVPTNISCIVNTIDLTNLNDSVKTMVNKIENTNSPYLNLKQSNLALSALQRAEKHSIPLNKIKPSELAIITSARNKIMNPNNNEASTSNGLLSIFNKREPFKLEPNYENKVSKPNMSYDGLGGHSKLETFPIPKRTPVKRYVPKVTNKHKLKRPSNTQPIDSVIKRFRDK